MTEQQGDDGHDSFRGDQVEPVSENGYRRIYRTLCLLAHCDGNVDPSERKHLDAYRTRFGIPEDEAERLEREGAAGQKITLGRNPDERKSLILAMAAIVAADGRLDPNEKMRLKRIADRLGVDPKQMIDWIKASLERRTESERLRRQDG